MELAYPGIALLHVAFDVEGAYEEEWNRWYDVEHLPERLSCPGFLSGHRYRLLDQDVPDQARYLAMFELAGEGVLRSREYLAMVPPSRWWSRLRPHVQVTRCVYADITKITPGRFELVVDRPEPGSTAPIDP